MLKFIPHAVFEVPHSIPHWGMGYLCFSSDPHLTYRQGARFATCLQYFIMRDLYAKSQAAFRLVVCGDLG